MNKKVWLDLAPVVLRVVFKNPLLTSSPLPPNVRGLTHKLAELLPCFAAILEFSMRISWHFEAVAATIMTDQRRPRQSSSRRAPALLLWLILASSMVQSLHVFSSPPNHRRPQAATTNLYSSGSSSSTSSTDTTTTRRVVSCPQTLEEMIRQVTSAAKEASEQGMDRQIVRILVPRDAGSGDFGTFFEASLSSSTTTSQMNNVLLVPPDESWQGGIMQLYRAVMPTAMEVLRRLSVSTITGMPDRVVEDRSVDESGVDGVGRLSTTSSSNNNAVDATAIVCYVQPTQETVSDYILSSSSSSSSSSNSNLNAKNKEAKPTTIMLLNPQWRQVNDALDTASAGNGLFSGLANFLGGKGGTLKNLNDAGYQPIYTLEGYVCRGNNVRLLQVLDSDWTVFCEKDNDSFIRVGQTVAATRPTYQQVDAMLQESDIGFKYARDIGLEKPQQQRK
jgi:Domain of unknown function (DUF1995)